MKPGVQLSLPATSRPVWGKWKSGSFPLFKARIAGPPRSRFQNQRAKTTTFVNQIFNASMSRVWPVAPFAP